MSVLTMPAPPTARIPVHHVSRMRSIGTPVQAIPPLLVSGALPRGSLGSAKVPMAIRAMSATPPFPPPHVQWPPAGQHLAMPAFTPLSAPCPLEIDELYSDDDPFDPTSEPVRGQLLSKMRLQPSAQIETLRGSIGSCNAGMWTLRDGCQSFVLKLVTSSAGPLPGHASQADKFARLRRDFPGISMDPSLAFPCKIFSVLSAMGKSHDLVVMRQVPGQRVSDVIMQKVHGRQPQDLMGILELFGRFLAEFHLRYSGMQHGDLTPANVFYDQASRRFTLVDVADIAPRNPVIQSDAERFATSLKLLSHFYGPDFYTAGKARFEAAYNATLHRRNF